MRARAGVGFAVLAAGVAFGTAGCAWRPFVPTDAPSRVPLMEQPMAISMGQLRDPRTGEIYFAPCNPCATPTPKTAAVVVPADRPIAPVQAARPAAVPTAPVPPPVASVRAPKVEAFETRAVYFGYASARLSGVDRAMLLALAKTIPAGKKVLVTGMADKSGSASRNRRLAGLRAEAVRSVLIEGGIAPQNVLTDHCLDCASTDAPRLARRAEIILKGDSP